MKYTVLTSFSGLVRGTKGGVIDITDPGIAEDLLRAGYIEEVVEVKPPATDKAEEVVVEKAKKPATKRSKKPEV